MDKLLLAYMTNIDYNGDVFIIQNLTKEKVRRDMKKISKFLVLTSVLVVMATGLTACGGKKAICDVCGEEKTCKTKEILGEEVTYCGDCKEQVDAVEKLGEAFGL